MRWGWDVNSADVPNRVGVLGASSFVGTCLLPLLTSAGWQVTAYSRRKAAQVTDEALIKWWCLPAPTLPSPSSFTPCQSGGANLPFWICVAPISVLPDYFGLLDAQGAKRVVVLSSTSRFTKAKSTDPLEQALVLRLVDAEARLQAWATSRGVEWVILRPTLIYGLGLDKNICEIARFVRRFGFFPVFGKANGLRQPVHAADVAGACVAALKAPGAASRAYNLSGGETLSYRDMVSRVFKAIGRRPRLLTVPLWAFRLAVAVLRFLPRYRLWSAAMAERMCQNLVFEHEEAARDLSFRPRPFVLMADETKTPA